MRYDEFKIKMKSNIARIETNMVADKLNEESSNKPHSNRTAHQGPVALVIVIKFNKLLQYENKRLTKTRELFERSIKMRSTVCYMHWSKNKNNNTILIKTTAILIIAMVLRIKTQYKR